MVPALLATFKFPYYLAVLAYGPFAFLLTTFFKIAVCVPCSARQIMGVVFRA